MAREGRNDESEREVSTNETLNLAEFVTRGSAQLGSDRAVLVVAEADDGQNGGQDGGQDGGGQQVFPLTRNPTVIGRSKNADLVLPDRAVSDFHARIIKHSFGYTVEDMGSAEGTYLRDKKVNHARLINGDTLRLGATMLTFVDERANARKDTPQDTSLVAVRSTAKGLAPTRPTALRDPYAQSQRTGQVEASQQAPVERRPRPADSEDAGPSIDDILLKIILAARYLRRHARLIVSLALVGITAGAASFKYLPPVRAAFCMVTLHPAPKANPIDPETRQPQPDSTQFFAGAERAFMNQQNIMAALKRLGVPNPTEAQAEGIFKRLRFENIGNNTYTALLTPGLLGARNDWHVQFLDAHVKNYVETEIEKTLKVFVAEVDFLRSQTESTEKRLSEIRQETVKFREANSDQILAQGSLTAGSPAELESKRIEVSGRIDRLAGELEGIRSQLARGSVLSQAKSQSAQADREALSTVNRKLTELRAQGFADGHPDVQRLLTEQRNLQKTVEEHLHSDVTQFEKRSNVAYDTLRSQADQFEAQLRAARAERGTIEASLRSLRTVSNESPKVNARLEELVRIKEEVERQHGLLFDRLQKAEVQLQLERVSATSRYEIVVPARLESPPGRKALATRLGIGLGIGLLLAALVLAFGELRRLFARVARNSALASLMVLLSLLPLGCAHEERFTWAADTPLKDSATEPTIHPRDTILVEVEKQPTLSGEFVVRDDGHYAQPMVGSVQVAGLTTRQVSSAVATALRDVVVTPVVTVWITKTPPIRVSVVGEVKTPGIYEMTRERTLLTVLAQAGWLTEYAHDDRVFVVRAGSSERIRFRVREITTAEPPAARFHLADADVVVVE
jgi:polysaccharide export outer membrane protein